MSNIDMNSYEALDKTISNLSMLDETLNYAIQRFDNQQNKYKDKVQHFLDRINVCQKKIAALQGVKKAIVFTSPSQFVTKYKFSGEGKESILRDYKQRHNINKFETQYGYQAKNEPDQIGPIVDNSRPDDLYQVLNIAYGKFKTREKHPMENRKQPLKEKQIGIGPYPKRIKCAESLLVMNTNINPYRSYQSVDNLLLDEKKYQPRTRPQDENTIHLQIAPIGIKDTLTQFCANDDTFQPNAKKVVNSIPIPMGMDLEDIAEEFDIDMGNGEELYQPSANFWKKNPTLPDPYANRAQNSQAAPSDQNSQMGSNGPPPPQQQQQQQQQYQQQYQQAPQQANSNIPPPPSNMSIPPPPPNMNIPPPPPNMNIPPPPPNMSIPQAPVMNMPPPPPGQMAAPPQQQAPAAASSNDRGALLDEIRNPTVKLRKTVTVVKGGINPDKKQEGGNGNISKTSTGLDPLAELKRNVEARFRSLHPPSKKGGKAKKVIGEEEDDENSERSSDED